MSLIDLLVLSHWICNIIHLLPPPLPPLRQLSEKQAAGICQGTRLHTDIFNYKGFLLTQNYFKWMTKDYTVCVTIIDVFTTTPHLDPPSFHTFQPVRGRQMDTHSIHKVMTYLTNLGVEVCVFGLTHVCTNLANAKDGVVRLCYRYRRHRPHKTADGDCYGYNPMKCKSSASAFLIWAAVAVW